VTVQRPRTRLAFRETPGPGLHDVPADVFDSDGLITDSARVHAATWKSAYGASLRRYCGTAPTSSYAISLCCRHEGASR
jgi:hypothetical protein